MGVIKIIYAFLQNTFVPTWGGWSAEMILLILATKKNSDILRTRQAMYVRVTLKCVRVTIGAMEKQ
jgi:hypothetical protein